MKNKLYIISSLVLCISVALCACGKDENNTVTTKETVQTHSVSSTSLQGTTTEVQTVTFVDESGYHVVSRIEQTTQERTHPPVPTDKTEPTYKTETIPQTQANSSAVSAPVHNKPTQQVIITAPERTTADIREYSTVPEKANGLSVQFKSASVIRGDDATVAINGEAGKEYTIEVYRNDTDLLTNSSLEAKKANSGGVVSWTFDTANCESGYRKIIIKEKGSDKYIQTSITVF